MKCFFLAAIAAACLTTIGPAQAAGGKPASAAPYGRWKHGPPSDPGFFPIAVWLQDPAKAADYKAAGINLYICLWEGPTRAQLDQLKAAGMPIFLQQTPRALAFKDDPIIVGWTHGDEPDNAQEVTDPKTGEKGYGPCVPPAKVVAEYEQMRAADPTRPIMLNLGQGVANDGWVGRGAGAKLDDYRTYVQGSDIVSFDVYPVASGLSTGGEDNLWYVPKGVERLVQWTGGNKLVWNCIECTRIDGGMRATPRQVRAEVWMALIHGSRGLIYFVHQFKPKFDEHALLDDPEMLPAVTAINRQIRELAPVLNSPSLADGAAVTSSSEQVPIATMVKRQGGATYLFAVGMRKGEAKGTFTVPGLPKQATAEVLGEDRRIPVHNGQFEDTFQTDDVHIYRIRWARQKIRTRAVGAYRLRPRGRLAAGLPDGYFQCPA